ncbi:MAG: SDR family NAD(P)-dependent oxidoreductase [Cyclobacteriaceae bacterium]|nr:SDR family NAD(P)-dependent oxidoreductase [Cyclobacteriaceae bacterium]
MTILITGSSKGIGKELVCNFSKHYPDCKIIAISRDSKKLQELKENLNNNNIYIIPFDINEILNKKNDLVEKVKEISPEIDILINNAGIAHGFNTIDEGSLDDWDAMIDINVKGLLYVSKAIIPGMVERKSGHIINIGSVAGKEVYAKGNVYCASKFAVDAISQGMRIDLNVKGIKVSEVNPGAIDTEFSTVRFKGDKGKADKVYEGFKPLMAEDIADIIYFVATRPSHVNIAETLVLPTAQASVSIINRI